MKTISLTKGYVAIVDDSDYEFLSQWRWYLSSSGYAIRSDTVVMHRLLLNAKRGQFVDHKNGDKLDYQRSNLRLCTRARNMQNRPACGRNKTSPFKGVGWHKPMRSWKVSIKKDGQRLIAGYFQDEHKAALAYDLWATFLHGEFAKTNFPVVAVS